MAKIITDGKTKIGAFMFQDRKKPCLCVAKGSSIVVYAHFINEDSAENFMSELAKFMGVRDKDGEDDG